MNGKGHGIGSFYFSSVSTRIERRRRPPNILRSLIPPLDACLKYGGFSRQSLTFFVGLLGTGKSFALLHMAMASVLQRHKTIYYSLEMSEEELEDRLDSAFAGVKTYDLRENAEQVARALELRKRLFGDNLLIQCLPAGVTKVSDIRAHLVLAAREHFVPDVIVVDHLGLLQSEILSREGRHRDLGAISVDLKGLSRQHDLWVISAAQANRLGYQAELLTNEHTAHSLEGPQNADYVITINRNMEEKADGKARLYLAKDRNGIDSKIIPIHTNFPKGALYSRRARV